MEEEEISRLSRFLSSSVHVDISDSGSVEEMSQTHHKLVAKPKWSAHADWPDLSEDSSTTPIPPWRDKSLWRITTTKTVEDCCPINQVRESNTNSRASMKPCQESMPWSLQD